MDIRSGSNGPEVRYGTTKANVKKRKEERKKGRRKIGHTLVFASPQHEGVAIS